MMRLLGVGPAPSELLLEEELRPKKLDSVAKAKSKLLLLLLLLLSPEARASLLLLLGSCVVIRVALPWTEALGVVTNTKWS